ncbi:MAG: hypothetical protein IJP53_05070 [Synergistaceae bacterium]|nr:hypothetical protein [Synergistaceae bacterium]MBR0094928.1 hypothetical protein [Synergistaceae bacterium]
MAQDGTKMSLPKDKKKMILIAVICVILLLNIMWTVLQSKFTPKLDAVQAKLTALEQRIEKIEQGGFNNMAELKEDFAALKAVSDGLAARLSQSLKAEEDQLATLEAQVAAQKARVEALKKATE